MKKNLLIFIRPAGMECHITGWGLSNQTANVRPPKLQVLKVKMIDSNTCKRERPLNFKTWHVCAGLPVRFKGSCSVIVTFC